MNTNKKITEPLASELIHELIANMLIVRDGLIQSKKTALRQVREIDREIKRIEEYIGKDTIKKITEGR